MARDGSGGPRARVSACRIRDGLPLLWWIERAAAHAYAFDLYFPMRPINVVYLWTWRIGLVRSGGSEREPMNKKISISVFALIYIVVGIIIAVSRDYITVSLLKVIGSALLAIFLWWLLLLGVNLHIH